MENSRFEQCLTTMHVNGMLSPSDLKALLGSLTPTQEEQLFQEARCVAQATFGRGIYVRGLLEISSYCRKDCYYCGLRRSHLLERYRLSAQDILRSAQHGWQLGFRTVVLQGGEDPELTPSWVADVVSRLRDALPQMAITLSLGEQNEQTYRMWREAGADRYLLRHETRDDQHYATLHPHWMSAEHRRQCLLQLRALGYQIGAGMMIGSPGQTLNHLVADLQYLQQLQPHMIGIGPFIPAQGTPFQNEPHGSVALTLRVLALVRIMHPRALIPATTALATLSSGGRKAGILAGANVVMPNLSPLEAKSRYAIYDHKCYQGSESADALQLLEAELHTINYHIDYGRGDYV